jgi:hypothetical protein
MGRSKRKLSLKREVATCLPALNHVTFYTHDEYNGSPSVWNCSGRAQGGANWLKRRRRTHKAPAYRLT